MSRPMADTPTRRPRRQFTDEFKAGAVRLVLDERKTVSAAARDLDLTETALREWVKRPPRTEKRADVNVRLIQPLDDRSGWRSNRPATRTGVGIPPAIAVTTAIV